MNIEVHLVEEDKPNYETLKAIEEVENKSGIRVNDAEELFETLGI